MRRIQGETISVVRETIPEHHHMLNGLEIESVGG